RHCTATDYFPPSPGSFMPTCPPCRTVYPVTWNSSYSEDVFVTKVLSNGTSLAYSTYLGGNEYNPQGDYLASDYSYGLAVDSTGSAYVVGTGSRGCAVVNPYEPWPAHGGPFHAKVNPSGSALTYS